MKKTNTIIVLALAAIFLGSCTVERRLYNKGLHVQWSKKYKSDKSNVSQDQTLAVQRIDEELIQEESPKLTPISTFHADQDLAVAEVQSAGEMDRVDRDAEVPTIFTMNSATSNSLESPTDPAMTDITTNDSSKQARKKSQAAAGSSGKSQMIALLLVIFVGIIGVHRFYLGYTGVGIFMLFTLGLFGILTLIDLIRIAVGDLKPKRGEYGETFEDLRND